MKAYIEAALRDSATRADDRGLMDLEEARELVCHSDLFDRGEIRMIEGHGVTDADKLWAALLSLEDANEFISHATRITWKFHPRGMDNIAPYERYGDALLPWLRTFIHEGVLVNLPWCVKPCLLQIGSREAFELIWQVRAIANAPMSRWEMGELEARPEADQLFRTWLDRHPQVGWSSLIDKAGEGDERALRLIKELGAQSPAQVRAHLVERLGEQGADVLVTFPSSLEPAAILDVLDALAEGEVDTEFMPWPLFHCGVDGRCEYHGLRLIAARSRSGDDWGVVLERLSGCNIDEAMIERFCYGSRVAEPGMSFDGSAPMEIDFDEYWEELEGLEVDGPQGQLVLHDDDPQKRDLRSGMCTEEGNNSSFNLVLRAYLHEYPRAFWDDPIASVAPLQLDDPEIIVVSDDFEHTLGSNGSSEPEMDETWMRPPSESAVYRSLAEAICARDGSLFEPGVGNLEWRQHVVYDEPIDDE